jgi:hypothetical protein
VPIVPADDKANARLIVSQIILDTFKTHQDGLLEADCDTPARVLHQLLTDGK